jgi:predicted PurR-regulated permease PerM
MPAAQELSAAGAAGAAQAASSTQGIFAAPAAQAVTLPLINALRDACLPAIVAACLAILASTVVTLYGRRRLDKDKELSNTAITFVVMLCAVAIQFGLTYLTQLLYVAQ